MSESNNEVPGQNRLENRLNQDNSQVEKYIKENDFIAQVRGKLAESGVDDMEEAEQHINSLLAGWKRNPQYQGENIEFPESAITSAVGYVRQTMNIEDADPAKATDPNIPTPESIDSKAEENQNTQSVEPVIERLEQYNLDNPEGRKGAVTVMMESFDLNKQDAEAQLEQYRKTGKLQITETETTTTEKKRVISIGGSSEGTIENVVGESSQSQTKIDFSEGWYKCKAAVEYAVSELVEAGADAEEAEKAFRKKWNSRTRRKQKPESIAKDGGVWKANEYEVRDIISEVSEELGIESSSNTYSENPEEEKQNNNYENTPEDNTGIGVLDQGEKNVQSGIDDVLSNDEDEIETAEVVEDSPESENNELNYEQIINYVAENKPEKITRRRAKAEARKFIKVRVNQMNNESEESYASEKDYKASQTEAEELSNIINSGFERSGPTFLEKIEFATYNMIAWAYGNTIEKVIKRLRKGENQTETEEPSAEEQSSTDKLSNIVYEEGRLTGDAPTPGHKAKLVVDKDGEYRIVSEASEEISSQTITNIEVSLPEELSDEIKADLERKYGRHEDEQSETPEESESQNKYKKAAYKFAAGGTTKKRLGCILAGGAAAALIAGGTIAIVNYSIQSEQEKREEDHKKRAEEHKKELQELVQNYNLDTARENILPNARIDLIPLFPEGTEMNPGRYKAMEEYTETIAPSMLSEERQTELQQYIAGKASEIVRERGAATATVGLQREAGKISLVIQPYGTNR